MINSATTKLYKVGRQWCVSGSGYHAREGWKSGRPRRRIGSGNPNWQHDTEHNLKFMWESTDLVKTIGSVCTLGKRVSRAGKGDTARYNQCRGSLPSPPDTTT